MAALITENDCKWKMITYGYYLFMNTYYYLILTITTYIRIRKKEYCLDFSPPCLFLKCPKTALFSFLRRFYFFRYNAIQNTKIFILTSGIKLYYTGGLQFFIFCPFDFYLLYIQ
nr:MAG TPA: hypothetical protein [Caudoviricetes sp.]